MSSLFTGQTVKVSESHNHIAAGETLYNVGAINRVQGVYNINLLHDGRSVGVIPENKLKAAR